MQWFINVGFSPFEIVITLIFVVLLIVPAYRVLERIGINGWFSVLAIIPFVSIIALWILAFVRWPSDPVAEEEEDEGLEPTKLKKSQTTQSEK